VRPVKTVQAFFSNPAKAKSFTGQKGRQAWARRSISLR
jgi:hypothetical protein